MGENVGELKKMLYDMAKANPERRFHSLYDKIWKMDVLTEAWEAVESNHGSPGIDGVKIEDIDREIEGVLAQLQAELRTRTYEPAPLKRVYIPKPNGKMRGLAIPTVRDRIVQAAVKIVMEPIFESYFEPCSFGFRPNRSAHDAVNEAAKYLNYGCEHVIDINIKGCFDNIPRDKLMDQVALRISHGSVLHLIRRILDAGIMEGGEIIDTEKGTPRGSPLSSLLANIYPLTNWTRHGNCLVWPIGMKRMRIPSDMQMMVRQEGNGYGKLYDSNIERPNVVTETAVYPTPKPCLDRDGNRLPGAAMQVEAPNHRKLLFHNGNGGERYGKGLARQGQVSAMETNKSEPLINCRKRMNAIKTGEESLTRDESGGAQADFVQRPKVGIRSSYLLTVQTVTGMEEASTLHRLCTRTWEPVHGCKGANPSRRTARNGSTMPFTGAEQPVVAVKSINVDGAKGLCYPVIPSGQPKGRNHRV